MSKANILSKLETELPPIVGRRIVFKITGGLISQRTMANLDSKGLGPKERIRVGRQIGYPRETFIFWFSERMQDIETANNNKK